MKLITTAITAGLFSAALGAFAATPDLPSCDVWRLACHYTNASREADYNINRVVIHKTQGGTASGAASWFQNCSSGGSAHFVFDKSNGYCYQCVYEADIAWHAGYSSTNNNSVGLEHSGWVANNDTSTACYNESAIETASCVKYYAVPANRSYIIGHSEVPGCPYSGGGVNCHSDPGPHWNWGYYMGQVTGGGGGGTLDVILDNTSVLFGASANWATSSSAADKYGTNYRYRPTAAISDMAGWVFGFSTAGSTTFKAWWSAGSNRSTAAPYKLPNGANVPKNQQVNGGSWQTLGTISAASGNNWVNLSCWAATGYVVVADAVRAQR